MKNQKIKIKMEKVPTCWSKSWKRTNMVKSGSCFSPRWWIWDGSSSLIPKVFRAILLLSETKHGKLEFSRMDGSKRKILFMEIIVQSLTARAHLIPVYMPSYTSLLKVPLRVNALGISPEQWTCTISNIILCSNCSQTVRSVMEVNLD